LQAPLTPQLPMPGSSLRSPPASAPQVPLAYTLQLKREQRLFLGRDAPRTRSRFWFVGWLAGAAAIIVLGSVGNSGRAAVYAGLGGASLGIWPGLLANFVRLWREEWAPTRSH
jgi:hypothetical protein